MYVRKIGKEVKISFQITQTVPIEDLQASVAKISEEVATNLHKLAEEIISPFAETQGYDEASMDSKGTVRMRKATEVAKAGGKEE